VAQNVARKESPEAPGRESTARRALISTSVAVAVVALALALWKLKVVVALLFIAVIIAAAMRPGVDWMAKHRIPRAVGVLLHYAVLLGLVAAFLSFVVPHLVTQVQEALNTANSGHHGGGFKGKILDAIQKRLNNLPSGSKLIHPALTVGETAIEVLVGILFTFASAAYWIFERDRTVDFVTSLVDRPKRKKVRDTWELIDLKLGAFVRGQLLLITIVAIMVSTAFWIVGEPYWLLLGISVALLEIVPVVGPLVGLILAVGAGLTVGWHTAVYAGAALLAIRVAQDYVINPRVMGGVVGISPLIVLVSVSIVGILFGGFYVLLSVPLASLVVTIIDVAVRGMEPADEDVPTVLFSREVE
jgi:predicted PurR-regulated permease PerM